MAATGLRICCLVKEVPGRAARMRIDPGTMRLERGGDRRLNPSDAHAIEAAIRIRETGPVAVAEVVALTMGPPSAARALERALALGADRGVHLCDEALAGSDALATGYALARALEAGRPDLVLCGQQSADGECYAVGPIVAEGLGMPSLTQVIGLDVAERPGPGSGAVAVCERQAEYGYDTVELELPAVVALGDAINEPRYPQLQAIIAAAERPIIVRSAGELGIDRDRVGDRGSGTFVRSVGPAPGRGPGRVIDDVDIDASVAEVVALLESRSLI